MQVIRTPRLVLRNFQPEDEDAVLAYRNDSTVARFQGWPLPYTDEHFRGLLDPARRLGDTGWTSLCICDVAGVCGDIGLRVYDRQAEVGISLASHAQGRGYATEALAALVEHAFGTLNLHRLHAGVDPSNLPVVRLFTRMGWRHEGTSVQSYWHRDAWADEATYALLAQEWRSARS